jgi:hypothetical protein
MKPKSLLPILFFALSIPRPSLAGSPFENFGHAVGDIVSVGATARQRDHDACEASKAAEAAKLLNQITENQGRIDSIQTEINEKQNQVLQISNLLLAHSKDASAIDLIAVSLEGFETQSGALDDVIEFLQQSMIKQNSDKSNLASWHQALKTMLPRMTRADQSAAQFLIKQIEFVAATRNPAALSRLIDLLLKQSAQPAVTQLRSIWRDLKARNTAEAGELQSSKTTLENQINTRNSDKNSLIETKKSLEISRNAVLARGC